MSKARTVTWTRHRWGSFGPEKVKFKTPLGKWTKMDVRICTQCLCRRYGQNLYLPPRSDISDGLLKKRPRCAWRG